MGNWNTANKTIQYVVTMMHTIEHTVSKGVSLTDSDRKKRHQV